MRAASARWDRISLDIYMFHRQLLRFCVLYPACRAATYQRFMKHGATIQIERETHENQLYPLILVVSLNCLSSRLNHQLSGDLEDSTAISSAMSHVSVESARSGSWSGSVVGGFGFVDYPAGIPPKQWVRMSSHCSRSTQPLSTKTGSECNTYVEVSFFSPQLFWVFL